MSQGRHGSNPSLNLFPMADARDDPRLRAAAEERHICSFCNKAFPSLQALGGHQTRHRREIETMRQQHEAFMEGHRRNLAPRHSSAGSLGHGSRTVERGSQQPGSDAAARGFVPMQPLAPNCAYWEAFRRAEQPPRAVDYIEIPSIEVVEQAHRVGEIDRSSEETITEPGMGAARQVEGGEEVESGSLDLTLKL